MSPTFSGRCFPASAQVASWALALLSCDVPHQELGFRGFESFLPLRRVRHRWSDRFKTIEEPIFPGYLFCRFDPSDRFRVLNTTGVAQIVGAGRTPIPVDESEIRSLRTLVASKMPLVPWSSLQAGQAVRIDWGALAGVGRHRSESGRWKVQGRRLGESVEPWSVGRGRAGLDRVGPERWSEIPSLRRITNTTSRVAVRFGIPFRSAP